MSQVKVSGNASGTGILTIAAPNTNTDYTLTLPTNTGTVLTSASSIPATAITGQGIVSAARMFRVNTSFSGSSGNIDANWEEVDSDGYAGFGDTPTQSSGVWTFPATGYWLIDYKFRISTSSYIAYMEVFLDYSSDSGSSYTEAANGISGWGSSTGNVYSSAIAGKHMVGVTNTSSQKIRLRYSGSTSVSFEGNSNSNANHLLFLKLGSI